MGQFKRDRTGGVRTQRGGSMRGASTESFSVEEKTSSCGTITVRAADSGGGGDGGDGGGGGDPGSEGSQTVPDSIPVLGGRRYSDPVVVGSAAGAGVLLLSLSG